MESTRLNKREAIVIMGPTASGKSALALALARRLDGEIISADSMQFYRGLEIGTAQPTEAERREIRHHLVGCFPIDRKVDVFRFVKLADAAAAEIRARGRRPIVVGGTGLYLRALLYCRRRLLRALEVRLLTGKSILELQQNPGDRLRFPVRAFKLVNDPAELRERIARRARQMLENGWIEEAEQAIRNGLLDSPTAHQAIGYRLIGDFLAGKLDRNQLEERIITATCQLARRQRTWFRHQHPEAEALPMPADPERLAARLS